MGDPAIVCWVKWLKYMRIHWLKADW
jgi:hypothetical protein